MCNHIRAERFLGNVPFIIPLWCVGPTDLGPVAVRHVDVKFFYKIAQGMIEERSATSLLAGADVHFQLPSFTGTLVACFGQLGALDLMGEVNVHIVG